MDPKSRSRPQQQHDAYNQYQMNDFSSLNGSIFDIRTTDELEAACEIQTNSTNIYSSPISFRYIINKCFIFFSIDQTRMINKIMKCESIGPKTHQSYASVYHSYDLLSSGVDRASDTSVRKSISADFTPSIGVQKEKRTWPGPHQSVC